MIIYVKTGKLRKRMLFHVQIDDKICILDVMIYAVVVMVYDVLLCIVDILKRLLCRANAHLGEKGENSSSVILALQEFSVTFKYRAGRNNVAADCLFAFEIIKARSHNDVI